MSLARDYAKLFAGLKQAYGKFTQTSELRDDGKVGGKVVTVSEQLTENRLKDLWQQHLDGKTSIGIVPINEDNCCNWGAVDVDDFTIDLKKLAKRLHQMKLPLVLCRSKSGGAHIFLFVFDPVPAALMQKKLKDIAACLGYGQAEIFPKQTKLLLERGDKGSALNMPYFGGEDSTRYAYGKSGVALTPEEFINYASEKTITAKELEEYVVEASQSEEWLDQAPPCLQHLITQGFPKGTRNSGLFNVGVFLRKKYEDDWEKRLEQVNMTNMSPPLVAQEVLTVIKQVAKKDYFYRCNDQPIAGHCNSTVCRTRKFGIGSSGGTPQFSNLTKQNSDPPIWFLDVEGGRLELETDDLLNQNRFQRKCMDALNVIPPKVKDNVWRQLIQQLLDTLTVIEMPDDASNEGHFKELLETFCTERPARERDEILLHKPWTDASKTYFRVSDLVDYLTRNGFKEYARNKITSKLRQMGGGSHFFNIKGKGTNVWYVPEFQTQNEVFAIPKDITDIEEEI